MASVVNAQRQLDVDHVWHFLEGDSLITRARNNCVARFLATDCTHLFFIDSDIIFSAADIMALAEADESLVCGLYPKKQVELEWVVNALDNGAKNIKGHLQEVKFAGTGFMCVKRQAVEQIIAAHPELEYVSDHDEGGHVAWDIFGDPVINRRKLSEDWFFCHLWRELGGKIWIDRRVWVKHLGVFAFPLDEPPTEEISA